MTYDKNTLQAKIHHFLIHYQILFRHLLETYLKLVIDWFCGYKFITYIRLSFGRLWLILLHLGYAHILSTFELETFNLDTIY